MTDATMVYDVSNTSKRVNLCASACATLYKPSWSPFFSLVASDYEPTGVSQYMRLWLSQSGAGVILYTESPADAINALKLLYL